MYNMARERRNWTAAEDAQLKKAVADIESSPSQPLTWHTIAATLPGRTNKDCRKRWHHKVAASVTKGVWTASEDARLCKAVGDYGTKWARVAADMKTRNGDQCSKRWKDTMDPEIDHSPFTPEEDNLLIKGVDQFGHNWKTIAQTHFRRRTALAAKNRYSLLCRRRGGGNQRLNSKLAKQTRERTPIATASLSSSQRGSLLVYSNTPGDPDQFGSEEEVSGNDGEMSSDNDEDEGYSEEDSPMGKNSQLGGFPSPADAPNLKDLSNVSGRLRGSYSQNPVGSSYDDLSARSTTTAQINGSREEHTTLGHEVQSGQATTFDYTYPDFSSDVFADFDALQRGFMQASTSVIPSRQQSHVNGNTCAFDMFNRTESLMHDASLLHSRGPASFDAETRYSGINQCACVASSNPHYQLLVPELSQQASSEPLRKGSDQFVGNDDVKQITITALCSSSQLGKLMQTVTDLTSSVTVLITEPSLS